MPRVLSWLDRRARKRADALADIRDCRASFEASALAANAAGSTYDPNLIPEVLKRFADIEQKLVLTTTKNEIETLVEQAEEAADLQAYLAAPAEIELIGKTALETVADWGVPTSSIEALRRAVIPKLACTNPNDAAAVAAARGSLHTILSEYTSWSSWLDDYHSEMQKIGYWLSAFIALSLIVAAFLLSHKAVVWGLLSAGACGALVSVVSKLPALEVTADSAPYKRDSVRRVCIGFAASVIGCGLLMAGLLPITLPSGTTFADLATECASGEQCSGQSIFVLLAVPMLFGLSERALFSFQERLIGNKSA
jgi:hypothetical protein